MTLNFGHRGASHEAPANTLAAFEQAAARGADGVELDVQLSRDGVPVVIHDSSVDGTTDGRGLVRDMTLAELKELDAGVKFRRSFAGERIPTLQEVADAVGRRLLLNIELKARGARDDGLAAAVVRCIEANHLVERVVVSSFGRLAIRRVRQINPRIPVGALYCRDPFFSQRPWPDSTARPDAVHPWHEMIDEQFMRWARRQGYRVHAWTVDDPARMRQLVKWGVDLVITNRPDLLQQVLAQG